MVDSSKLDDTHVMIYAGYPSFFGVGLEDGHIPFSCNFSQKGGQRMKPMKQEVGTISGPPTCHSFDVGFGTFWVRKARKLEHQYIPNLSPGKTEKKHQTFIPYCNFATSAAAFLVDNWAFPCSCGPLLRLVLADRTRLLCSCHAAGQANSLQLSGASGEGIPTVGVPEYTNDCAGSPPCFFEFRILVGAKSLHESSPQLPTRSRRTDEAHGRKVRRGGACWFRLVCDMRYHKIRRRT